MRFLSLAVLAVAVCTAQAYYNSSEIADIYINLGANDDNPTTVNCTRYAQLFLPNGILHQPGVPDVQGWADIAAACQTDHAQVNPLISFQELNIGINSWDMTKRTAFSWVINGVRTRDQMEVFAPAISVFFQDKTGYISEAWSFYDDTLVQGTRQSSPPFNGSALAEQYTRLGSLGYVPAGANCHGWANLYTSDGVNNEPGIPPTSGSSDLQTLCQSRASRFKVYVPSVQEIIPVMSWNTEKRLAFRWTITGQTKDDNTAIVPAISVLFINTDGLVTQAWDWWDTTLLPNF